MLSLDDVDYYTYECHDCVEFYEPKFVHLLLFFGLTGQIQLLQNFCETNSCKGNLLIGDLTSYSQIVLGYCRFTSLSSIYVSLPVNVRLSNLMSFFSPAGNFTGKIILYNQPTCFERNVSIFIEVWSRRHKRSCIPPELIKLVKKYAKINFDSVILKRRGMIYEMGWLIEKIAPLMTTPTNVNELKKVDASINGFAGRLSRFNLKSRPIVNNTLCSIKEPLDPPLAASAEPIYVWADIQRKGCFQPVNFRRTTGVLAESSGVDVDCLWAQRHAV